MRILFRCDGGSIPEIGTGHLVRCLLLADRLREEGHAVAFAVARDRSAAAR
ncbi:MAG: UDP-2,4-diacetamido-2,4,6-trideoxy-beta-L-altropyranose hydrolase, partial [Candidatus Omnitrophica bacterium]|nr:UDP-2,4-diacetamido-2,4,6-trideoxy-beta-L-altropyranose hydrolase [Candidatus Omnitrophota bacterium]